MTYRISATTLEAYRLYLTTEWMDFDRLAEQLRGKQETTPLMVRGTSLHEILEMPPEQRSARFGITVSAADKNVGYPQSWTKRAYKHLGWAWDADSVDAIQSDGGINEMKVTYDVETTHGIATLVAKADKVNGLHVIDYKTTANKFKAEKYLDSVQWRIYCLAFGANAFTYRVFELAGGNEPTLDPIAVKETHDLPCTPYLGMATDVHDLTEDFVGFCLHHGFKRAIGIEVTS